MYDVVFLNKDLETEYRAKTIDYYWHSRWYEPGEFQIQIIDDTDFDFNACRYVVTNTKKEIGVVGRWQRKSDDPQVVLLSGMFFEQELFHHVVYPTYSSKLDVWAHSKKLCSSYLDDFGLNFVVSGKPSKGVISDDSLAVDFQQTGDYVGTALYALASVYGYGVTATKTDNGIAFGIANYHDRTGETEDEEVVVEEMEVYDSKVHYVQMIRNHIYCSIHYYSSIIHCAQMIMNHIYHSIHYYSSIIHCAH